MLSPAKLAANRSNAQRSTGPRTPDGKRRAALNATAHGLRAANPVPTLPNEDPAPFCAFRDQLHADHAPRSALEVALVDRLASLLWRLNRCPTLENDLANARLARRRSDHEDQYDPDRPRWRPPPFQAPRPQILLADDFSLRDDRANPLMRLQRYEAALERSLQRTLAQLHALQKLPAPDTDTDIDTDADAPHAEESPIEPTATDPPVSSPPPNNQNQQNEPTAESTRDAGVSPPSPSPAIQQNEPTAPASSDHNAASAPSAPLRFDSSPELPNEPNSLLSSPPLPPPSPMMSPP